MMHATIYQTPLKAPFCFSGFEFAKKHDFSKWWYNPVWSIEVDAASETVALEKLFEMFNVGEKPKGYCGRSLSVSDVVVLGTEAWYCDSFGWRKCTDMWNGRDDL